MLAMPNNCWIQGLSGTKTVSRKLRDDSGRAMFFNYVQGKIQMFLASATQQKELNIILEKFRLKGLLNKLMDPLSTNFKFGDKPWKKNEHLP